MKLLESNIELIFSKYILIFFLLIETTKGVLDSFSFILLSVFVFKFYL